MYLNYKKFGKCPVKYDGSWHRKFFYKIVKKLYLNILLILKKYLI